MAHKCPECGVPCYCGGDIDDIVFVDRLAAYSCTHCPAGDYPDDDDEPIDDEDEMTGGGTR